MRRLPCCRKNVASLEFKSKVLPEPGDASNQARRVILLCEQHDLPRPVDGPEKGPWVASDGLKPACLMILLLDQIGEIISILLRVRGRIRLLFGFHDVVERSLR